MKGGRKLILAAMIFALPARAVGPLRHRRAARRHRRPPALAIFWISIPVAILALVTTAVLFLLMIPFVPLFLFASMYAQISLGESASETGLYLLIFFAGFFVATQWDGRILDTRGARPTVVLGCLVAAVGFALWAREMPELSVGSQWPYMVLAGVQAQQVFSAVQYDFALASRHRLLWHGGGDSRRLPGRADLDAVGKGAGPRR